MVVRTVVAARASARIAPLSMPDYAGVDAGGMFSGFLVCSEAPLLCRRVWWSLVDMGGASYGVLRVEREVLQGPAMAWAVWSRECLAPHIGSPASQYQRVGAAGDMAPALLLVGHWSWLCGHFVCPKNGGT